MIPNYTPPQFTLQQSLRVPPARSTRRTRAVVLGTQYLLSLVDGRDLPEFAFSSTGAQLSYDYIDSITGVQGTVNPLTHQILQSSVKLWGSELEAEYAAAVTAFGEVAGKDNQLRLSSGNVKGGVLNAAFDDRAVAIGDVFSIETDNTNGAFTVADDTFKRKVIAFLPKLSAAAASGPTPGANNVPTVGADSLAAVVPLPSGYSALAVVAADADEFVTVGGKYEGALGDEFTIACIAGGATPTFRVTSVTKNLSMDVGPVTPVGNTYTLALTTLYAGLSISFDKSSDPVLGETLRVGLKVAYTISNPFTINAASNYTGEIDRVYTVQIVEGCADGDEANAVIRVYDASGTEPIQTYDAQDAVNALGTYGMTLTVTSATSLVKGDTFLVQITAPAESTTEFDGVVLDGPVYDSTQFVSGSFRVSARVLYTGYLDEDNTAAATDPLTVDGSDVDYAAGLGYKPASVLFPFVDATGTVAPIFKAAVIPSTTEGPVTINNVEEIPDKLGEIHLENDAAYGAFSVLTGANETISVVRVLEDTTTAFSAALKKISSSDIYYALAVISEDIEVAKVVKTHCETMSNKSNKNFRVMFFGTDSPGEIEWWGQLAGGGYRQATLLGDVVTVRVEDREVSNFVVDDIRVGDIVSFPAHGDFTITEVLANGYDVRVANPLSAEVAAASAFTVVKPDTAENAADYVIRNSRALSSRRAVNVWVDNGTALIGGVNTVIPNKYVAAELAGQRVAASPQQGLSNSAVTSVTNAPGMYTRFDADILNRMASEGVWIVTQVAEDGDIFTRHQLTTDVDNGQVAWEAHSTVVRDTYCFSVKDGFAGFVGKRNVTAQTIRDLKNLLMNISVQSSATPLNDPVGPLITYFSDEDGELGKVTVRRDPDITDKILTYVLIGIAMPLNDLDGNVEAEASLLL